MSLVVVVHAYRPPPPPPPPTSSSCYPYHLLFHHHRYHYHYHRGSHSTLLSAVSSPWGQNNEEDDDYPYPSSSSSTTSSSSSFINYPDLLLTLEDQLGHCITSFAVHTAVTYMTEFHDEVSASWLLQFKNYSTRGTTLSAPLGLPIPPPRRATTNISSSGSSEGVGGGGVVVEEEEGLPYATAGWMTFLEEMIAEEPHEIEVLLRTAKPHGHYRPPPPSPPPPATTTTTTKRLPPPPPPPPRRQGINRQVYLRYLHELDPLHVAQRLLAIREDLTEEVLTDLATLPLEHRQAMRYAKICTTQGVAQAEGSRGLTRSGSSSTEGSSTPYREQIFYELSLLITNLALEIVRRELGGVVVEEEEVEQEEEEEESNLLLLLSSTIQSIEDEGQALGVDNTLTQAIHRRQGPRLLVERLCLHGLRVGQPVLHLVHKVLATREEVYLKAKEVLEEQNRACRNLYRLVRQRRGERGSGGAGGGGGGGAGGRGGGGGSSSKPTLVELDENGQLVDLITQLPLPSRRPARPPPPPPATTTTTISTNTTTTASMTTNMSSSIKEEEEEEEEMSRLVPRGVQGSEGVEEEEEEEEDWGLGEDSTMGPMMM
eukprot:scaffold8120_cov178-Ochromonas_danica.AAC.5